MTAKMGSTQMVVDDKQNLNLLIAVVNKLLAYIASVLTHTS